MRRNAVKMWALVVLACLEAVAWGATKKPTYTTTDGKALKPIAEIRCTPRFELKSIRIFHCEAQGDANPKLLVVAIIRQNVDNDTDVFIHLDFHGRGKMTLWAERPKMGEWVTAYTVDHSDLGKSTPLAQEHLAPEVRFEGRRWVAPERRPKFEPSPR